MALEHNHSLDYDYEEPESNETFDYSQYELICVKEEVRSFARVFLPTFFAVAFVVGLVGNCTVVAVYAFHKKQKTKTDVYILNLAAADLLLLFTLPLWAVNAAHGWVLGTAMCKVTSALYTINFVSGMHFLACISVDRYVAVTRAARSPAGLGRSGRLLCVCVWAAAVLLSIPQLLFYTVSHRGRCVPLFPHRLGIWVKAALQMLEICVGFVAPFLIMAVCYLLIARALLRTPNIQKSRPLRVVLAVVAVFIATQLPFNLVKFCQALDVIYGLVTDCALSKRLDVAIQVTESLALFHSCLNPVLYVFMGASFKSYLAKVVKKYGPWAPPRPPAAEEIPFDSENPTEPTSTFSI